MNLIGTSLEKDIEHNIVYMDSIGETSIAVYKDTEIVSAYKIIKETKNEYCYKSKYAKDIHTIITDGLKGCTSKNGYPVPFTLGTSIRHEFKRKRLQYTLDKFNNSLCGILVISDNNNTKLELQYTEESMPLLNNIDFVELRAKKDIQFSDTDEIDIPVRSLSEISLEKDTSWLDSKKYYIVNDDELAEKLFKQLENYNGAIAYDTETTGLKINMFGKINSKWSKQLKEYNSFKDPSEKIRADRLVGIIFCVKEGVSYYFPCFNRKFKNLYEDKDSTLRNSLIANIKSDYTIGKFRGLNTDMANYWRNTPAEDIRSDCLLMERCRHILTTKHLVAHNGAFEWKVSQLYDIDINLKDDTMILHQLMYKFRSTTSNAGESSALKYLTKREFGIDQLELTDFFTDYKEDTTGTVKGKRKKGLTVDFSYMDYEGAKAYAPADGDTTLALYHKYKKDLVDNHQELVYIYNVEVIVACAVGYMEFYGHRIDEDKIQEVRDLNIRKMLKLEYKIREISDLSNTTEKFEIEQLEELEQQYNNCTSLAEKDSLKATLKERADHIRGLFDNSLDTVNLASPSQVASLLFDRLSYPFEGDKKSVAKSVLKGLIKAKDNNGNAKYPVAELYSEWKKLDTLVTKFFDALPEFMYPNGFIFSSYGQISTATGRMSARQPNSQQYSKDITKIVVPRDNNIILDADFSQIEYRTLVALGNEPKLAELFKDPDNDYHTLMASLMYGVPYASVTPKMRSDAKSFNFGIPYGMGFKSLAILLTGMSGQAQIEEAKEKYELYFKDQPNIRKFFEDVKERALMNRFTKTYWNRYRYYSFEDENGNYSESKKAMALRQAGNAVIQGCVHPQTKILTYDYGLTAIEDINNHHLRVWNGEKWTYGDVVYSGKKRKCVVTFETGQQFICSPTHKFLVKNEDGSKDFIECQHLKSDNSVVMTSSLSDHTKKQVKSAVRETIIDNGIISYLDIPKLHTEAIREVLGALHKNSTLDNGDTVILYPNKDTVQELQKCMLMIGIKAYNTDNCLIVKGADRDKLIEFISTSNIRQDTSDVIGVASVEVTDEYIDMYDICNTDEGYYVADGVVTHNTAADIFKISVARNFLWIRNNNLIGKVFIINMVHDEQLMEIDCNTVNTQVALKHIIDNMQFEVEGFPPLYVGAGFGSNWAEAKGKMAEIHPHLARQLSKETEGLSLLVSKPNPMQKVLDYYNDRVYKFRFEKVKDYILNKDNWGKEIHPVIGNLIQLQFTYGLEKDYKDNELTLKALERFISNNNLDIDISNFTSTVERVLDTSEEDEDALDLDTDLDISSEFKLIDESSKSFGISLEEMIKEFGLVASKERKALGLDINIIPYKIKDSLMEYIAKYQADPDTEGAMEVVFLKTNNILFNTGVYVANLDINHMVKSLGLNSILYK